MLKHLFVRIQSILPQHLLSTWIGKLSACQIPWLKNSFITLFVKYYQVDMSVAAVSEPTDYPSFNDFFIRRLKPGARTIAHGANDIACPVDGSVAEIGRIQQNQLLQVKHSHFDLETLLDGDTELAQPFYDGYFATLYLAPKDYHRVHMPISGVLLKTLYVPGKLFSVNATTTQLIPHLYCQNERYITLFDTAAGPMIVIFVGALIVGSIQMSWMQAPVRETQPRIQTYSSALALSKGEELGYFKMGSTVMVLFQKNQIAWSSSLQTNDTVLLGQVLGQLGIK